jgi:cytoskeletal protein CcmA (bactofilin family)
MWKKPDEETDGRTPARPTTGGTPTPPSTSADRPTRPVGTANERATIGRSITIRGDVSGDEDLMIQGRIEGSVQLGKHHVTVGPEGRVKANISGRSVTVEGEVKGDLHGDEQVALRPTARVEGDIVSPRVVLDDGASFRGSIDMSNQSRDQAQKTSRHEAEAKSKPGDKAEAPPPSNAGGREAAQSATS